MQKNQNWYKKSDYKTLWAATWFLNKRRFDILKKIFWENKSGESCFLENSWEKISREVLKKIWEREDSINKFFEIKNNISLEKQKIFLDKYSAKIIFFDDDNFPKNLKNISDSPIFLYVQWEILEEDFSSIAVVWARKISHYWKEIIKKFIPVLSKKLTIISWLALWIDGLSHLEALNSWWRTIWVIWSWLDVIYPIENSYIYRKILEKNQWAIITEFPFWTKPERHNFPLRNRIVAGLTLWTLIVEAREKSWSLITANLAIDYNREVFSVPWSIFSHESWWTNSLIKKWLAKPVSSVDDILEELNLENKLKIKKIQMDFEWDEVEKKIFSVLENYWKTVDKIAIETWLEVRDISSKLVLMEMKWFVMENASGSFIKII